MNDHGLVDFRAAAPGTPDSGGWLRSHTFPGLWLDPAAVWDDRVFIGAALDQGLAAPEHAAFVKRLAKAEC